MLLQNLLRTCLKSIESIEKQTITIMYKSKKETPIKNVNKYQKYLY